MKKALNRFYVVIAVAMSLTPTSTALGGTDSTAKARPVNRGPALAPETRMNQSQDPDAGDVTDYPSTQATQATQAIQSAATASTDAATPRVAHRRNPNRRPASTGGDATARGYDSQQLNMAELQMIRGLDVSKEGRDPDSTVVISGMVPQACIDKLRFEYVKGDGVAGFSVIDNSGRGRDCLKANKDKSCGEIKCVRLSQLPDSRMVLSDLGDVTIGLMHRDPNKDKDADVWEAFKPEITHKSGPTIRSEREAAASARNQEVIRNLRAQMNCRKTDDDIARARTARELLASMGVLTEKESESFDRSIEKAEFDKISGQITRLNIEKQADELAEALESLRAFVGEHSDDPKVADAAAALLVGKAQSVFKSPNLSLAGYNRALSLIDEASNLPGLNDESQTRMQSVMMQAKRGKFERYAQDPRALQDRGFQQDLQAFSVDVQNTAQGCAMNQDSNNEVCGQVQQSMMSLYQVQAAAQRTQQSFMMQQQQRMMSYYQMGMGLGMGYNSMMNPMMMNTGYNPMMMGGYNPMMMGGGYNPMMMGGMMGGMSPMMGMNMGMPMMGMF